MTHVWILHNPFLLETEIKIDGNPIAETSRLHKYIKTPMQNWVNNFLPALVEHCNDDELDITFKGLQHNYEDLEAALTLFLKKNRDYEIELHFEPCASQVERLQMLADLVQEIRDYQKVDNVFTTEFVNTIEKSITSEINILVYGNNDRCQQLIGSLYPAVRALEKTDSVQICGSQYSVDVERAISSVEKPVLVCLLDEPNENKEHTKIMNQISNMYNLREPFQKWRVVFVADNPQYARRVLSSDYAIKTAEVYASDDTARIFHRIEEYRNEVCLVQHLEKASEDLVYRLSIIKQRLAVQAEQQKNIEQINELEQEALKLVDTYTLKYTVNRHEFEKSIDTHFSKLQTQFSQYCFPGPQEKYIDISKVRERAENFIMDLSSKLRVHLTEYAQEFRYVPRLEIKQIADSKNFADIFSKFDCDALLRYIRDSAYPCRYQVKGNCHTVIEKSLCDIENSSIVVIDSDLHFHSDIPWDIAVNRSAFYVDFHALDFDDKAVFRFYDGFRALVCRYLLESYNYWKKEQLSLCEQAFSREINRFRPIFKSILDTCIALGEAEFEIYNREFKALLTKSKDTIRARASQMREEAKISAEQQKRLDYIQQLLDRAEDLTRM